MGGALTITLVLDACSVVALIRGAEMPARVLRGSAACVGSALAELLERLQRGLAEQQARELGYESYELEGAR